MKEKSKNGMSTKIARAFLAVTLFVGGFAANGYYVYAADIGKKISDWGLEQIFWIGVVVLAVVLITCLIRKAWIGAVITGVCGGLALFFINDPVKLVDMAESIFNAIMK